MSILRQKSSHPSHPDFGVDYKIRLFIDSSSIGSHTPRFSLNPASGSIIKTWLYSVCRTVGIKEVLYYGPYIPRMVVSNSWGISGWPESIANVSSGIEEPTAYASYLADLAGDIDNADMASGIGIDHVREGTAPRRNTSWPSKEGKSK